MTTKPADAAATVAAVIVSVAPDVEAELPTIDPACDAFEELQLDSMDHLNVMAALAERTGLVIPESEYAGLRSIEALTTYLSEHLQGA
jgi:acyl carrier protein